MRTLRHVVIVLPWILVIGLIFLYLNKNSDKGEEIIHNHSVVERVTSMGKLELVKYSFKEITELSELSKEYWNIFKLGPDSKIALISEGYALGCIDLTQIKPGDITESSDTVIINLPEPEICTYKLDLEKTRIYSLQTNPFKDEREFIQKAYKTAERQIKNSAITSGVLDQTRQNANLILKPILEQLTGKVVLFSEKPDSISIPSDDLEILQQSIPSQ